MRIFRTCHRINTKDRQGNGLTRRCRECRLSRFAPHLFQCRELLERRQGLGLLRELDVDWILLGRELVLEVELVRFHQGVLEFALRMWKIH